MSKELKQLKNKIRELLPELKEKYIKISYDDFKNIAGDFYNYENIIDLYLKEIPITLEDIFIVFVKIKVIYTIAYNYTDGSVGFIGSTNGKDRIVFKWTPNKPLSEQSPDTIDSLNKLIA